MTVTLTSPVLGKAVGDTYTGTLEAFLLAEGYAQQDGYTGPGVSNSGAATFADPADDPRLPENREEKPYFPLTADRNTTIANDADNLGGKTFPAGFDFDRGGVDDDAPINISLAPAEGAAAGGTEVTVTADSLEGATGVTFGGVAGTNFVLATDGDSATVTTPAGTAGPVDVVVTGDPQGDATLAGGFTYTA